MRLHDISNVVMQFHPGNSEAAIASSGLLSCAGFYLSGRLFSPL